jgi:hypoxanthine phosphoribosyltransferase
MAISWGKDADYDHMAEHTMQDWTAYDYIIAIFLGGLAWGALLGLAWMIFG